MATYSCGKKFVSEIRPFLETCEADLLIGHLRRYWPNKLLRDLLFCGDDETVTRFCRRSESALSEVKSTVLALSKSHRPTDQRCPR